MDRSEKTHCVLIGTSGRAISDQLAVVESNQKTHLRLGHRLELEWEKYDPNKKIYEGFHNL